MRFGTERSRLKIMNIIKLLTPKSETAFLYDDYSLRQGLEKMKYHGYRSIPVISRDGKYTGTISEGDFLWFLLIENEHEVVHIDIKNIENLCVKDIIDTQKYPSVSVTATRDKVFDMAMQQNFIPVVDDRGFFMGIITRQAIMADMRDK